MESKVQKWGNSLGLRIPKSFAKEAQVEEGSTVDITLENGALVVRSVRARYDLRALIEGINPRNVHKPVETGPGIGHEAW